VVIVHLRHVRAVPRDTLTRDQVVEDLHRHPGGAADALSMRQLAQRLDATAPTCWHEGTATSFSTVATHRG
jgi:hypothetical protein